MRLAILGARLLPALGATAVVLAACGAPAGSAGRSAPGGATSLASTPAATTPPTAAPVAPSATPAATAAPPVLPTGATWTLQPAAGAGPAAREDHTWTVDGDGRVAYLFGGRDGSEVFDDLWAFELATASWRQIEVAGPGPEARFGHEAAWVPGRGLVVSLGQAGADFFDDIWLFDPAGATWQRLPDGGDVPVARYGSCSGIGPDGRFWISHGFTEDGVRFADTKAYDIAAGVWQDEAPAGAGPVERCLHACWWTSDGDFTLYGGQTTGVPALGDLWRLTPGAGGAQANRWTEVSDPEPAARQLAAVGRWGTVALVFGGRGTDRKPLRDLWFLADGSDAFVALPSSGDTPPARSGAALIHDPINDRMLLFGGLAADALDDLWELRLD